MVGVGGGGAQRAQHNAGNRAVEGGEGFALASFARARGLARQLSTYSLCVS